MFISFGLSGNQYITVVNEVKFEYLKLNNEQKRRILQRLANDFIEKFIQNVKDQKTWGGEPLSKNQPYTLQMKALKGYGDKTLIAKDRDFLNPNNWEILIENDAVLIRMIGRLKDKYLDLDKYTLPPYNKNYTDSAPNQFKKEHWEWILNRLGELIMEEYIKI